MIRLVQFRVFQYYCNAQVKSVVRSYAFFWVGTFMTTMV